MARAGASRAARPRAARSIRVALAEVQALLGDCADQARPADRASASHPGQIRPHLRGAHGGARRRDEARADRGLRGRDLLCAFRRGEGGRDAASAGHGARVRLAVVLDGGRGASAAVDLPQALGPGVRVVRAPCMGACDRAPVCAVGHMQVFQATPDKMTKAAAVPRASACVAQATPISSTTWRPAATRFSARR